MSGALVARATRTCDVSVTWCTSVFEWEWWIEDASTGVHGREWWEQALLARCTNAGSVWPMLAVHDRDCLTAAHGPAEWDTESGRASGLVAWCTGRSTRISGVGRYASGLLTVVLNWTGDGHLWRGVTVRLVTVVTDVARTGAAVVGRFVVGSVDDDRAFFSIPPPGDI